MKRLSAWLAALALATALCGEAAAQIRVGSIADSRGGTTYTLDGSSMTSTRAKLLNPLNFGPTGVASPNIQIIDTAATIDATVLSGFNVLFIGWIPTGTFTAGELSAMQTWVNGGGTIIATCDDSGHSDVCTTFGHTPNTGAVSPVVPTGAGATTLFAGPFGAAPSVTMQFTQGFYPTTAGATVLGQDSSAIPNATVLLQSFGAGRVIFISDVDIIADFTLSAGSVISNNNDRFLGNLFAFAGNAAAGTPVVAATVPALDPKLLAVLVALLALFAVATLRNRA
jgi:hypothetical protein